MNGQKARELRQMIKETNTEEKFGKPVSKKIYKNLKKKGKYARTVNENQVR